MTEQGDEDAERLRARLSEIDAQLLALSLPPAPEFGAPTGMREELESEAASIRDQLGLSDPRPPLTHSSRTGWMIAAGTALVVAVAVGTAIAVIR
ncbi:hypothetical protein QL996_07370 [Planococcus sp. APC 4015]|nr:hypothetical protein [Planococcus sp. APC 4015]